MRRIKIEGDDRDDDDGYYPPLRSEELYEYNNINFGTINSVNDDSRVDEVNQQDDSLDLFNLSNYDDDGDDGTNDVEQQELQTLRLYQLNDEFLNYYIDEDQQVYVDVGANQYLADDNMNEVRIEADDIVDGELEAEE